jgi:hypothetical protein
MKLFHLDPSVDYFKPDAAKSFSPFIYFHKTQGIACSSVISNKKYSVKLVDYLSSKGELISFTTRVKIYHFADDSESITRGRILEFNPELFFDQDSSQYIFYYKNNIVFVNVKDAEFCEISLYFDPRQGPILSEFDEFLDKGQFLPKPRVSLIIREYGDIIVKPLELQPMKDFDVELNYGKDFLPVHEKIVDKLNNYNNGGLYHFSGGYGTGKTSYTKYLTSLVNRQFIFIPITLTDVLNSPDFLSILLDNKNSVLVIEDAEKVIRSRNDSEHSLVSTILNMADGILSSLLKISIIVTHNTDRANIDQALLRKGRLIVDYEFNKLSVENSQKLVDKLNFEYKVKEPMSLADIYNLNEDNNLKQKEIVKIGF